MKAVDGWFNVNMGELGQPSYMVDAARDVFGGGEDYWRNLSMTETLDLMDEHEVERAVLTTVARAPSAHVLSFVETCPQRFSLAIELDPRRGMSELRELSALARNQPVCLARVIPFYSGLAPNEAPYFPIYARCVDLDLPISVNTGIPGPPAPGACQHPMHLDEVCCAFPELTVVMAHGADPWWDFAIRLMARHRKLYLMTSAFLPKYLPTELIRFMDGPGQDRVIFASDHPAIPVGRCLDAARKLPLTEQALAHYLYKNLQAVLHP